MDRSAVRSPARALAARACVLCVLACCLAAQADTIPLVSTIAVFFEELAVDFAQAAQDAAVKGVKGPAIDQAFIGVLRGHPTVIALVRVDAKGKVISEVIRGKVPERPKHSVN